MILRGFWVKKLDNEFLKKIGKKEVGRDFLSKSLSNRYNTVRIKAYLKEPMYSKISVSKYMAA